jgi:hypothetical protein
MRRSSLAGSVGLRRGSSMRTAARREADLAVGHDALAGAHAEDR